MSKKYLFIFLIIFSFFISCTEFERFWDQNRNNSIYEDETEDANFDKTTSGSSTTAGNPGNDEPIGPPVPSLTKFIVTSVDSDKNAVAMATGSMNSDYGVLVTNEIKYSKYLKEQNTFFAKTKNTLWQGFKSASQLIFSNSFAKHKTTCPAETLNQTCLYVNKDGTIDSTALPDFDNKDSLSVAYFDLKTGIVGDKVYDSVLTGLVYLSQDPADEHSTVLDGDGNILQISKSTNDQQTKIVKMKFDNNYFKNASGDYDNGYLLSNINGSKREIHYNFEQGKYAFGDIDILSSYDPSSCGEGDELINCQFIEDGIDSTQYCGSGCVFVSVKNKSDRSYYSTKYETVSSFGTIEELYRLENRAIYIINDASFKLHTVDGIPIQDPRYIQTKTFDLYFDEDFQSWRDALVVIEDGNGDTRLIGFRSSIKSGFAPAITTVVNNLSNVKDLVVITPQPFSFTCGEIGDGNSILLVGGSDGSVHFLDYDLMNTIIEVDGTADDYCAETEFDGLKLDFDTSKIIYIKNPVSWVFNDNKSLAFVLNEDSIFIIDVNNRKLIHKISLFVNLSGKEIDLSPRSIIYNHDHLIVGTSGIGSVLVFDVREHLN